MENIVNYAVAYAKAGLSVLPMHNKKPLIKFADCDPLTVEEIKKIWQKYPFANIAIRTDKFFVVDIDRHEGGSDGFKAFEENAELFKPTLEQKTAGGGKQLFYLKRDENEVRQNIGWKPGIDIKAHRNNYVVVAPSVNSSGNHYEWLNKKPMVQADKQLVRSINKGTASATGIDFAPYSGIKTKTTVLFETIMNGFGDNGGRNNNLTHFIGGLLFRNVDPKVAYNLATIANDNTADPLPVRELDTTFKSVLNKEIRRRGAAQ